jgi:hypothetical protein
LNTIYESLRFFSSCSYQNQGANIKALIAHYFVTTSLADEKDFTGEKLHIKGLLFICLLISIGALTKKRRR